MTQTASPRTGKDDKRDRLLRAALELIPQLGLHNTPISAIAERAGVAKGTPYLYFDSKEALIDALYQDLSDDRDRAIQAALVPGPAPREQLWAVWSGYARWHLDHRDALNFIQQCEASGILSTETRAREAERQATGAAEFAAAIRQGVLRDLPLHVFFAHFMGPILVLSQSREKQEIEITDELLLLTFEGVERAVCVTD